MMSEGGAHGVRKVVCSSHQRQGRPTALEKLTVLCFPSKQRYQNAVYLQSTYHITSHRLPRTTTHFVAIVDQFLPSTSIHLPCCNLSILRFHCGTRYSIKDKSTRLPREDSLTKQQILADI